MRRWLRRSSKGGAEEIVATLTKAHRATSKPFLVGEDEGTRLLREVLHRDGDDPPDSLRTALKDFLAGVEARGFVPMRLHFAITRYRRWAALSADSTPPARARTLQEFWDTYGLARVVRVRVGTFAAE